MFQFIFQGIEFFYSWNFKCTYKRGNKSHLSKDTALNKCTLGGNGYTHICIHFCPKHAKFNPKMRWKREITSEIFLNWSLLAVFKISKMYIQQKRLYNINIQKRKKNMSLLQPLFFLLNLKNFYIQFLKRTCYIILCDCI